MSARTLALGGLCGLAALGLGACAGGAGHAPKSLSYMVTAPECEFFKYGPAQAFGPDLSLKRGDRVTLIQKQFGYSRVLMANGTAGYVSTEDIAPAPAPVLPPSRPLAALTRGRSAGHAGPPRQSDVRPTGDPLFDINDVPSPPLPSGPSKPDAH